jgi:hypothetical protein
MLGGRCPDAGRTAPRLSLSALSVRAQDEAQGPTSGVPPAAEHTLGIVGLMKNRRPTPSS